MTPSRKTKVVTVFSAVMMLNERFPTLLFGHTEVEIDNFVIRCSPREARDISRAQFLDPVPVNEIFKVILEEYKETDANDPNVILSAINTLFHYAAKVFKLEEETDKEEELTNVVPS